MKNKTYADQEYEELKDRAISNRIYRLLQGSLSPTRQQVVNKLNRERKEHEEGLERDYDK